MIGEFQRGATFRAKQEVSIFETIPLHECETGLYVTQEQLWEVDGFNEEVIGKAGPPLLSLQRTRRRAA